jgi:CheY-like chemotaxis protein/ketosteroid isomerase-like protein
MDRSSVRVLLVDDDTDNREVLSELLEDAGFQVLAARSTADAVFQLNSHDVQVVLADYQLSHLEDPWGSLEKIRQAAAPAPVGIVTGWRLSEEEIQKRGLRFVIGKPYDCEALVELVAAQIQGLEVAAEHAALVHRYFQKLSERDWDGFVALCTEDVRYHLPGTDARFAATVSGRAALRKFTEETFAKFPGAQFTVKSIVPAPGAVVGRYTVTWSGLAKPQGGAVLFHFANGLIREVGIRLRVKELAESAEHLHPR